MKCKKTQGRLSAYLDGALPAKAASRVRQHLEACPSCAAALDQLTALSRALDTVEGLTPSPGFAGRIIAAARAQREQAVGARIPAFRRFSPALVRAAAVLTMAAGLWLGATLGGTMSSISAVAVEAGEDTVFDLQVESLSAAPPGSLAETYLDLVAESE